MIYNFFDFIVDIYVNGENVILGLVFCDVMLMLDLLMCMLFDIVVVFVGGMLGDVVVNLEDVVLEDGKVYLVMVSGVVGDVEILFMVVIND